MEEIIRQYGRMICVLAAVAALLSMLFAGGSKGGLMRRLAGGLVQEAPAVANAAEGASRDEFIKEAVRVCARGDLSAGEPYRVSELLVSVQDTSEALDGGKILSVHRLYDGKRGIEDPENISDEVIVSGGRKVVFPGRGLYRLCLSVRDRKTEDSLQYVFVPIEGAL